MGINEEMLNAGGRGASFLLQIERFSGFGSFFSLSFGPLFDSLSFTCSCCKSSIVIISIEVYREMCSEYM